MKQHETGKSSPQCAMLCSRFVSRSLLFCLTGVGCPFHRSIGPTIELSRKEERSCLLGGSSEWLASLFFCEIFVYKLPRSYNRDASIVRHIEQVFVTANDELGFTG